MRLRRVCVFCGSNSGARKEYAEAARKMGTALARRGLGLVYGGGHDGLMGIVANAATQAGAEVIGITPEILLGQEAAHLGVSELRVVSTMHERKAMMSELSDAFIALPGGYGTFEELCEILTWAQLGFHRKPCGLLNVENFYSPLLDLFERAVTERFMRAEHRALLLVEEDPDLLLEQIMHYKAPPHVKKRFECDEVHLQLGE